MYRASLALRLIFVVASAALLLQFLFVLSIYIAGNKTTEGGFRFPLPDAVAAIVELVEEAATEDRALILRAVNSGRFKASIMNAPQSPNTGLDLRLPQFEKVLRHYIAVLDDRKVHAMVALPEERPYPYHFRFKSMALLSNHSLLLNIELKNGEYLILHTQNIDASRFLIWPVGLGGGFIALLIALLAMGMVWKETKPLRDLSDGIQRFAQDMLVFPIKESGADDLRHLIRAFNSMQKEVAKLYHGRSELLLAISHDIRTYLTRLRMRIEPLPEEQRLLAERDIEDMLSFTDEALTYADTASTSSLPDVVNIGTLVGDVINSFSPSDRNHIFFTPDDKIRALVQVNTPQLRRAFTNVIDNALKYGHHAFIHLNFCHTHAEIVIEDAGLGIPLSERSKVLEPFYRIELSRNREFAGTGLGLAITNRIVLNHKGRLLLEDRLDHGSSTGLRLRIVLPLTA